MDDLDGGVQSCLPKESDPNADDGSDPLLGKEGYVQENKTSSTSFIVYILQHNFYCPSRYK